MSSDHAPSDFKLLATAANYIRKDIEKEYREWIGTPFEWVKNLPAATKGKLGKLLVYQWCALKGLDVSRCNDSEADMMINGHRVEVKFSTLWAAGFYKFQQIRDQNFEYAVCLGISPSNAHCWVLSKQVLKALVIGHMGQHTGSGGKETAWITINPEDPPSWVQMYGGDLEKAYFILKSLSR